LCGCVGGVRRAAPWLGASRACGRVIGPVLGPGWGICFAGDQRGGGAGGAEEVRGGGERERSATEGEERVREREGG
jgi:hypothetical protein